VPDLEPFARLRFGFFDVDTAHDGRRRAGVKPFNKGGNCGFFAGEVSFHCSVGAIPYPARHVQFVRLLLRPGAEKHALHAAGHPHVTADTGHHTTLRSGASSAFIPTTL